MTVQETIKNKRGPPKKNRAGPKKKAIGQRGGQRTERAR